MKTAILLTTILLLAVFSSGGTSARSPSSHLYTFSYENVLGTSLDLKIGATSLPEAESAEGAVLNEIDREAKILSAWDTDSEFSRWMRTSREPISISPELFEVLGLFDKWRARTGGALDASAEVITRLWKMAEKQQRLPSSDELSAAVGLVRQAHWQLDRQAQTAIHSSRTPLVLSSFTKSYIAGHAADIALASGGVSSVVVNIGGDLVVRGDWSEPVDIADPMADAENGSPIARLTIHDRAIATSGNYRRGFEIAGRHYSHIVDPRTGMTAEEIVSSTVVAQDPADAGAMATAFSVLTPSESQQVAASIPGVEFLLVMNNGRQVRSSGWGALEGKAPQIAAGRRLGSGNSQAWNTSYELVVNVELPQLDGRAQRPYMAVWIEDQDKFPVRTIALWFNKDRFLPELKVWHHAAQLTSESGGADVTHSVSSATRSAGKYTLKWDGKDDTGKLVKPGRYTVFIEAVREHGGYVLLHQEMEFYGNPNTIQLKGNTEVANASLEYRRIKID
jgi:thiamine biosynthesis lipoprotein ApbE